MVNVNRNVKCGVVRNMADAVQRLAMTDPCFRARVIELRGTFLDPAVVRLGLTSGRPALNGSVLDLSGGAKQGAVSA